MAQCWMYNRFLWHSLPVVTPVSMVPFSLVTETWHYLWWPHWNITFTSLSLSREVDTMMLVVVGEWDFWKLFKMISVPLGFLYMITTNTFLCYFLTCHYIFIIYVILCHYIFHIIFSLQKRMSILFINTYLKNKYIELIFKTVGYISFPFSL